MNSKFKRTRIAALLLIASSTASTACAQSYTPASGPQYGASHNGMPTSNENLPPIVSGSQHRVQPIVRNGQGTVPPIVSGSQNRQLNRQTAPMVSEQSVPRQSSNQSGVAPSLNQNAQNGSRPAASGQANPLRPIQFPQIIDNRPQLANDQGGSAAQLTKPSATPSALPQAANGLQAGQVLSASGVPFYSSRDPKSVPRMRVEEPSMVGNRYQQSEVQDGSNESILDSGASAQPAQQPVAQQPAARQPRSGEGMSSVMAPRNGQDAQLPGEGANAVIDPRMNSRGSMEASGATAQNYFEMDPRQAAFTPGCQDCIAAGGVSNCPTCSPDSSYAMGASGIDSTSGYFGAMSRARRYAELDLLYLTRTDGGIVFSNFGGLGAFDWGGGLRFTLGQREDETQGRELSYLGTSDIGKTVDRTDPGFRLSALFVPVGIIDASLVSPFFGANIQNEQMETQVHSFELNKVDWAWDVVKTFWGFRFIYVDDSYTMFSQRGVNTAELALGSTNYMFGWHIGREYFYDIGYRFSFSGLGKLGLYANANQFEVDIANNGTQFFSNRNDSSTFSTSIDFAFNGHYQINRRARLRAGYNFLLLNDIYSISDNLTGTLSPYYGDTDPSEDSMIFQGFSFGLELYR